MTFGAVSPRRAPPHAAGGASARASRWSRWSWATMARCSTSPAEHDGVVVEAFGSGNMPPGAVPAVRRWLDEGKPVVLATRCAQGEVTPIYAFEGGGARTVAMGAIPAGPAHAVAGTHGADPRALGRRRLRGSMSAPSPRRSPDEVLEIARTLESAGHEAWCVGGALRDALLGHPHTDYDFATSGTPAQVLALFRRTAPVGEKYGTVGVLDRHRVLHEVTTFRRDVDDRWRATRSWPTACRSRTISPGETSPSTPSRITRSAHEWRDPFGGRARPRSRHAPRRSAIQRERFREDYLRILRAVRFAARFGFAIEPATWAAAVESAPGLAQLSAERVAGRMGQGPSHRAVVPELVGLWVRIGAAQWWMPELTAAPAERVAGRGRPARAAAIRSCSPPSWSMTPRRRAAPPPGVERRDRARGRHRPGPASPAGSDPRAVRRWLSAVGRAADDLWRSTRSHGGPVPWADAVARHAARRDPCPRLTALGGRDLQALGAAGARIGEALALLLDGCSDDPVTAICRDALLALARESGLSPWFALRPALGNVAGALAVVRGERRQLCVHRRLPAFGAGFMLAVVMLGVLPR